jgi:hypothetical protein
MNIEDIEDEIGKLKSRKVELTNKMNMTTSFDDKEDLKQDIGRLDAQIEILEKLKIK